MTLKLIYQIKATQGITGLIKIRAQIKICVWHLDVGLAIILNLYEAFSLVGELIP